MKILLVNTTKMVDDSGGLAKVTSAFANEMHLRGHKVTLIYADERSGEFFYPIDKEIKCYDARLQNGKRIKFPLSLRLKREIFRLFSKQKSRTVNNSFYTKYICPYMGQIIDNNKPDVIVSFTPGDTSFLIFDLQLKNKIPIVTMSHGDPADYFKFYPKLSLEAIKQTDVNQVLLPSFKQVLLDNIPNGKVVVIGNVVQQFEKAVDIKPEKTKHKILFIGRLSKEHKRPHLLIEAFSKVAKDYPDWIVEFWGADENKAYKTQLEFMVKQANLSNRIFFKGVTKDIESVLNTGDIYAMMSAMEGFGLSMAEAMSKGLPVIACNSWNGIMDMVNDGVTGILVQDKPEEIAKGLEKLMDNTELRNLLGNTARESMKRFEAKTIWNQWDKLLNDIIKSENNP